MSIKKAVTLSVACALGSMGSTAFAHTTSIGYVPGSSVGEVTFWTGSYNHSVTPVNEGTLTLTSDDGLFDETKAFDITPNSSKPSGLTDGTNNFYWDSSYSLDKTLTSDPNISGGVVWWQGVTFSGLLAGTYDFTCGSTCGSTAQWASWGDGSGSLTLSEGDVSGGGPSRVPEPGTLGLFALGGAGLAFARRRGAKQ